MKRFSVATAVTGVAAIAALAVGSAVAAPNGVAAKAKIVAFTASYSGTATTQVTDGVAAITATGAGKALLIGAGKITGAGKGDASQQPCVPFSGPGKMTGAKGTIAFTVLTGSSGCGDEGGHVFSITGKAKVVKATGALAKAKGTLKFTGVYDKDAGTFSVKFKGSLTR